MTVSEQRFGIWCGPAFVAFLFIGLLLPGWIPPPSPMQSPAEVAAMYQANPNLIRLGMLLILTGSGFILPFVAAISTQMRRMQGVSRFAVYLQLGAGSAAALVLLLPPIVLATAAFRPDRDPQVLSALNDLGWLMFITPFPLACAQNVAIAIGTFMDHRPDPVFTRWLAYFNLWVALLFVPGGLAVFFKVGPFAWAGLLSFWVAAGIFGTWFVVMAVMLHKAVRAERGTRPD